MRAKAQKRIAKGKQSDNVGVCAMHTLLGLFSPFGQRPLVHPVLLTHIALFTFLSDIGRWLNPHFHHITTIQVL